MARWQGTTTQRGLGWPHQSDKARLLKALRPGKDLCWRCMRPMWPHQKLDRDHLVDRALGGTTGRAVLAHARCNRSAGATLGNQLRGLRRKAMAAIQPSASRDW